MIPQPTEDAGGWRYLFPPANDGVHYLVPSGTYGNLMGWLPIWTVIDWTYNDD